MRPKLPTIAITAGDAAGIGPELALACAANPTIQSRCRPLIYGPERTLRRVADRLSIPIDHVEFVDVNDTLDDPLSSNDDPAGGRRAGDGDGDATFDDAAFDANVVPGTFTAATGRHSFDAVCLAIDDALSKKVDAIVTGPIQKEAWRDAGITYPGHTELLADRTGTKRFAMMLAGDELAVLLVTVHVPLADVASMLTTESIFETIQLATPVAKSRGRSKAANQGDRAVIAVCGLNPHAGENGLMSHHEEKHLIEPAIAMAKEIAMQQQTGLDVIGPLSPDTAFTPAMRRGVDVYVCMYHDQGLIPLKALSFDDGINVTLGLPIIRTSVDHGTAMDLAWQGTASTRSMESAIDEAIALCR